MHIYSRFDSVLLLVWCAFITYCTRIRAVHHNLLLHAPRSNVGVGAGSVAFQGSVGEGIAYFASLGSPLPPFANAAEHAVQCLDADHGALRLPTLWRLRRLQLLHQTVSGLVGADAAHVQERLVSFLRLVAYTEDEEAAVPDDMPALAEAVAAGGGTYLALVRAMLACAIAADKDADAAQAAMQALGLSAASPAPRAVQRLNDVAARLAGGPWFCALYADFAAAIACRMGICGPATQSARKADDAAAESGVPAEHVHLDQAAQLERAFKAGGWNWQLAVSDVVQLMRQLGCVVLCNTRAPQHR